MEGLLLPQGTRPLAYDIRLTVDMGELRYRGEETIRIHVANTTQSISLHADEEIAIESMTLDGAPLEIARKEWQVLTGTTASVETGEHDLRISFSARISWENKGFVCCQRGENFMAYTHFEPIYARQALPCFDEPQFKAVFKLAVDVQGDYEVLSNTLVQYQEGNLRVFQPTPLMSVYLLQWTICHLTKTTQVTRETTVNVYTLEPHSASEMCVLACRALDFLEDYFDYKYVLPKLDLVSLHSDR